MTSNKNKKKLSTTRYWVFPGPSWIFICMFVVNKDELMKPFSIVVHDDRIKRGDMGILWGTDDLVGCYGIVTIGSDPYSPDSGRKLGKGWKAHVQIEGNSKKKGNELICDVETIIDLSANPILEAAVSESFGARELKRCPPGNNLELAPEQYDLCVKLANRRVRKPKP